MAISNNVLTHGLSGKIGDLIVFRQAGGKTLIARVPALPNGQYTLRVVTRFSNSAVLLNEPRVIEYDRLLTV